MTALPEDLEARAGEALRTAGARFALVVGSRARTGGPGPAPRPESDLDVAAWWDTDAPQSWSVAVPEGVDLVVLNHAPLWLAGRAALWGRPLFAADETADRQRVAWQVDVRMRYFDELPGIRERYAARRRQLASSRPVVEQP